VGLALLTFSDLALGKDKDDGDDPSAKAAWAPNVYLDLRTTYATIPADTLSIGLGNPSLSARFPALATLSNLSSFPAIPTLPTLSSGQARTSGWTFP
jgi:hypothetical protein